MYGPKIGSILRMFGPWVAHVWSFLILSRMFGPFFPQDSIGFAEKDPKSVEKPVGNKSRLRMFSPLFAHV